MLTVSTRQTRHGRHLALLSGFFLSVVLTSLSGAQAQPSHATVKRAKASARVTGPPVVKYSRGRYRYLGRLSVPGLLPRTVRVYLPEGYNPAESRRYPVLYAHDGQYVFRGGLSIAETLDKLTAEALIPPHILVGIDRTEQRSRELKPSGKRGKGASLEAYAELLLRVIKPRVDATFNTDPSRKSSKVIGYSLGGLANLYFAVHHPEVFGVVGCMSPSLWWGRRAAIDAFARHKGKLPDRLWIDSGTLEGRVGEAVPYFIEDIRALRDIALAKKMRLGKDLGYYEHPNVPHADWAGRARMRPVLMFLLSPKRPKRVTHIELTVFRPKLSGKHRISALAVEATYGADFRMTLPANAVKLESKQESIVQITEQGHALARAPGRTSLVARYHSLTSVRSVSVRGQIPETQTPVLSDDQGISGYSDGRMPTTPAVK